MNKRSNRIAEVVESAIRKNGKNNEIVRGNKCMGVREADHAICSEEAAIEERRKKERK